MTARDLLDTLIRAFGLFKLAEVVYALLESIHFARENLVPILIYCTVNIALGLLIIACADKIAGCALRLGFKRK